MNREVVKRTILYVLVLIAALYIVIPYLWVVLVSFMQEREATQLHWIPRDPTLENYLMYFRVYGDSAEIGAATATAVSTRAIVNSFIIGGTVMFINLFFGSLAAYALARMNFGGNLALLLFYLGSRSVPGVAIMIPMYLVMRSYRFVRHPYRGHPCPCNLYATVHYLDSQGLFPDCTARFGTCGAG